MLKIKIENSPTHSNSFRELWKEEYEFNKIPISIYEEEFRKAEKKWRSSVGTIFPKQDLIELIISTCNSIKLEPQTKYTAISLLQRYMKQLVHFSPETFFSSKSMELRALTSLQLSSKRFDAKNHITVNQLIKVSEKKYSKEDFVISEKFFVF